MDVTMMLVINIMSCHVWFKIYILVMYGVCIEIWLFGSEIGFENWNDECYLDVIVGSGMSFELNFVWLSCSWNVVGNHELDIQWLLFINGWMNLYWIWTWFKKCFKWYENEQGLKMV